MTGEVAVDQLALLVNGRESSRKLTDGPIALAGVQRQFAPGHSIGDGPVVSPIIQESRAG
jgi:hypothetical protein